MGEEVEGTPETIKAEIEAMVKAHPRLVIKCVTEKILYIVKNAKKELNELEFFIGNKG